MRSLQPYRPRQGDGERPHLLVERLGRPVAGEITERLGNAGDGLHTCWDGHGVRLMHESAGCRLLFGDAAADARLELEPDFPWWRAWSNVVRPLLSIPIAAQGAAVVHASAVHLDGQGIAIAGWAESGKTEVALALCERDARFMSDKWTVLGADGTLHAMPVPVGLRAWTLPYLPQLRGRLGVAQRTRATAGRTLVNAVERFGAGDGGPAATAARDAARRFASLAGRVSLPLPEFMPEGNDLCAELSVLVVLRANDGPPAVRVLDPRSARHRLVTTTAYERRMLDQLDARSRYSSGAGIANYADLREREEDILDRVLRSLRVVELAAPFPADPRPAAEALLSFLQIA